jgi:hypothetical protein
MKSKWSPAVMILGTAIVLLFACGGGGGGGGSTPGGTPDTTAPTIVSTTPANSATDVALNITISAIFSEPVASVDGTTFTLKNSAGSVVSGSVSYSGVTAVFSPSVDLDTGTTYTASITTAVKDLAGNALAADHVWAFTTGTTLDTTPPTVISTSPPNGATDVSLTTAITVTFSEAMDCSTISAATVTIHDAGSSGVSGGLSCGGSSASFTPASHLTASIVYTVLVTTGVKDSAGNALASDYTWSFATAATGWGTAVKTDPTATNAVGTYSLGVDGLGNVLVICGQYNGSFYGMHANRYVVGSGWGSSVAIGGSNSAYDNLAVNANGNGVAVWREWNSGAAYDIYASYYTAGSGWSLATRISDTNSGAISDMPAVAMDASGNAIAVWQQAMNISSGYGIYSSRYAAGSGWGAPEMLGRPVGYGYRNANAQVAVDANGNAMAVWSEYISFGYSTQSYIQSRSYDLTTGWSNTVVPVSSVATFANYPQTAFDGSGNAYAVWQQTDGTLDSYAVERSSIFANQYTPGAGWGTPEMFSRDLPGSSSQPRLAVTADGKAVAAWNFRRDAGISTVYTDINAAYYAGSAWGMTGLNRTVVDGHTGAGAASDAGGPAVAIDGNGKATLAWHKSDGTLTNVYSMSYTAGTVWTSPTMLGSDAYNPKIVVDGNGVVTGIWGQNDGTRYVLWSDRSE